MTTFLPGVFFKWRTSDLSNQSLNVFESNHPDVVALYQLPLGQFSVHGCHKFFALYTKYGGIKSPASFPHIIILTVTFDELQFFSGYILPLFVIFFSVQDYQ
jgi:hypothetical protein